MGRSPFGKGRLARPLIIGLVVLTLAAGLAQQWPLAASPMLFSRSGHSAVRLADGRVLVTGGTSAPGTEIYDPATDRWTLADAMRTPRQGQAAMLLADGRVLVAGGAWSSQAVEIYDPAADRWSLAAPLQVTRGPVVATTLADGRVLVVGGNIADASVEIYDPGANTWTLGAPAPAGPYLGDTAALTLRDGRVLAIGSYTSPSNLISLYTPGTNRWAVITLGTYYPVRAAPLPDGRVLILAVTLQQPVAVILGFDPASGAVQPLAQFPCLTTSTLLTPLADGRVLALGSDLYASGSCSGIYDPASDRWARARGPADHRAFFTATELGDGVVLLAGGLFPSAGGQPAEGSSERYDLATAILDQSLFLPVLQQYREEAYPGPTPYVTVTPTMSPEPTQAAGG